MAAALDSALRTMIADDGARLRAARERSDDLAAALAEQDLNEHLDALSARLRARRLTPTRKPKRRRSASEAPGGSARGGESCST